MTLPWYVMALGAALVWGMHYPLVDHALKRVSLISLLLLTAAPLLLITPLFLRSLVADYAAWQDLSWGERLPIVAIAFTSLAGTLLLYLSIGSKNATLASLIEVSYPVFVALFAYALFREANINTSVLVGAAFIFTGVGIIIWNNP